VVGTAHSGAQCSVRPVVIVVQCSATVQDSMYCLSVSSSPSPSTPPRPATVTDGSAPYRRETPAVNRRRAYPLVATARLRISRSLVPLNWHRYWWQQHKQRLRGSHARWTADKRQTGAPSREREMIILTN